MSKKVTILNIFLALILLFSFSSKYNNFEANASTDWRGYAIYRDGVVLNLNDHAGLMNKTNIGQYLPVIHAPGVGNGVIQDTWNNFVKNDRYIGIYRPKTATMNSTLQSAFVSKARELESANLSYTILDQLTYFAGQNVWVWPENIFSIRCDGVVEYVYEWYGYRVGGPDGKWDITRNLFDNYDAHQGFKITPRKQHQELLTRVSTNLPN